MHAFYAPHRPSETTVTQPAFSRTHLAGTLASTDGNDLLCCPNLVPASAAVHLRRCQCHGREAVATLDAIRAPCLPPTLFSGRRALWRNGSIGSHEVTSQMCSISPAVATTLPSSPPGGMSPALLAHGMTTDASRTCQLPRTHGKPQSGCEQRAMWCMGCACAQAYLDTQPNLGMVAAATANSV